MLPYAAMLIDTHTHLDDARYNDDRDATIARAQEVGVTTFITIGCDLTTSRAAVALAGRRPMPSRATNGSTWRGPVAVKSER